MENSSTVLWGFLSIYPKKTTSKANRHKWFHSLKNKAERAQAQGPVKQIEAKGESNGSWCIEIYAESGNEWWLRQFKQQLPTTLLCTEGVAEVAN